MLEPLEKYFRTSRLDTYEQISSAEDAESQPSQNKSDSCWRYHLLWLVLCLFAFVLGFLLSSRSLCSTDLWSLLAISAPRGL